MQVTSELPSELAGWWRLLSLFPGSSDELKSIRSLSCNKRHAAIKHQRDKHSRVQFPACLLATIYHADQLGPVFLISGIWQNKRDYRKCVLVKILFEECCWTLIVPELGLASDEAPRFLLEWRWKFWEYLPLSTCVTVCSWLPASAPFFSRKLPPALRKEVTG